MAALVYRRSVRHDDTPGAPAPAAATPLRLLALTTNYPPFVLGGAELALADVVAGLCARGHHVTVLTTTYGLEPARLREDTGAAGEHVVRGLDFQWRDFEIRRHHGIRLLEAERRQVALARRVVREAAPDVAIVWHLPAVSKSILAAVGAAGVPLMVTVQEPWPAWDPAEDAWTGRWSRPAVRPLSRAVKPMLSWMAARLVAPTGLGPAWDNALPTYASEWLRQTVEATLPAWRGRGVVVGNGIELARARRERADDAPLGRPLRLLYAGRVEHRKGVHTAVEALAVVRRAGVDATLDVVGWEDATYAAGLRAQATRLGVGGAVQLTAALSREALADAYLAHDVTVFPTVWPEPFGLVPLEAMATGCVVTATGSGGSGEYLEDGVNALLHGVEDAAGLAVALRRIATDPALVARLRGGGRLTAARYDMPLYVARLEGLAAALGARRH